MTASLPTPTISIRPATANDGRTLVRPGRARQLPVPFGQVLIAEVDGQPKAALSLADGRVVADPFSRTAELVGLLRMHAGAVAERARPRPPLRRSAAACASPRSRRS
jgi:hypothetical protein